MIAPDERDPEINAIANVCSALKPLDSAAQKRVLEYVLNKFSISYGALSKTENFETASDGDPNASRVGEANGKDSGNIQSEEFNGISPVGLKWMRRNGLEANQLASIFSIGGDEIDLVAKEVPGETVKARMRNVFLLKGLASYLGGGAARFGHAQAKEACLHYKAWDQNNFSKHIKAFGGDLSGSTESGYTLTARGMNDATDLIKQISAPKTSG